MKAFFLLLLLVGSGLPYSLMAQTRPSQSAVLIPTYRPDSYISSSSKIEVFEATRIKTKVDILWEAAITGNGRGYEIQRRMIGQDWQRVAFVFPQTENGFGNNKLIYEFTDVNTEKAETQYRLRIMNSNNSYVYSEVRTIKGMENLP